MYVTKQPSVVGNWVWTYLIWLEWEVLAYHIFFHIGQELLHGIFSKFTNLVNYKVQRYHADLKDVNRY